MKKIDKYLSYYNDNILEVRTEETYDLFKTK